MQITAQRLRNMSAVTAPGAPLRCSAKLRRRLGEKARESTTRKITEIWEETLSSPDHWPKTEGITVENVTLAGQINHSVLVTHSEGEGSGREKKIRKVN